MRVELCKAAEGQLAMGRARTAALSRPRGECCEPPDEIFSAGVEALASGRGGWSMEAEGSKAPWKLGCGKTLKQGGPQLRASFVEQWWGTRLETLQSGAYGLLVHC